MSTARSVLEPSAGSEPARDGATNVAAFPAVCAETRPCVIALHCSGGTGRQWRHLAQALGGHFDLIAPDLIGCGRRPHWSGPRRFWLTDEARAVVAMIDALGAPVHLVGHSYGGAVALRTAMERPHRVASLSLYEPTPFHVLKSGGPDACRALAEIRLVAHEVDAALGAGAREAAAARFVDYWNGAGSFAALKPEAQADLIRYVPKASLDFHALLNEPKPLAAYGRLRIPLRILSGDRSPEPALQVARRLAAAMNPGALRVIEGAAHMGPFSHAELVAQSFAAHIAACAGASTVQAAHDRAA